MAQTCKNGDTVTEERAALQNMMRADHDELVKTYCYPSLYPTVKEVLYVTLVRELHDGDAIIKISNTISTIDNLVKCNNYVSDLVLAVFPCEDCEILQRLVKCLYVFTSRRFSEPYPSPNDFGDDMYLVRTTKDYKLLMDRIKFHYDWHLCEQLKKTDWQPDDVTRLMYIKLRQQKFEEEDHIDCALSKQYRRDIDTEIEILKAKVRIAEAEATRAQSLLALAHNLTEEKLNMMHDFIKMTSKMGAITDQ